MNAWLRAATADLMRGRGASFSAVRDWRRAAPWTLAAHANVVRVKGGSYARFRRALDTGSFTLVRAAAAELATINLDDALRICLLLPADRSRYEHAVIRWLGQLCLEPPDTTLTELVRYRLKSLTELPHLIRVKIWVLSNPPEPHRAHRQWPVSSSMVSTSPLR